MGASGRLAKWDRFANLDQIDIPTLVIGAHHDTIDSAHMEAMSKRAPEVSAAMLRGDSLLRAIRRWRDKTQSHLEAETGIGQGYLSDLENGRRAGTPETLSKLARALDVPVDWVA